jgi:hypothetical protein
VLGLLCVATQPAARAQTLESQHWQLFDEYCSDCHILDDYAGGYALYLLTQADVPQDADAAHKGDRMVPPQAGIERNKARASRSDARSLTLVRGGDHDIVVTLARCTHQRQVMPGEEPVLGADEQQSRQGLSPAATSRRTRS